jgi:hypothetical protein
VPAKVWPYWDEWDMVPTELERTIEARSEMFQSNTELPEDSLPIVSIGAVVLLNDVNLLLGPLCALRHVTPLHSSYHVAADIKIFCNSTVLVHTNLGMMPPDILQPPSGTLRIPCIVTLRRGLFWACWNISQ